MVTTAAHHWQATLGLVIQTGACQQFFVLLSYGDGSTAIYRAIDDVGTIGVDWWGIIHAPSMEDCLAQFAEEHGVSLDALQAAIGRSTPDPGAATRTDQNLRSVRVAQEESKC
jgi:hypothetical protein